MSRPDVIVGDPHVLPNEIPECRRLIEGVAAFAREHDARRILFLGDQHHTMSVVHVEVVWFWKWAYRYLAEVLGHGAAPEEPVWALVGNHDMANDRRAHIMVAYPEVRVVDAPLVWRGILHLPYLHEPADVVEACRAHPEAATVVCHAMFSGSVYENGQPVLEGAVNPADLPQALVVTGHNHKPQRVGKVLNVGAPRWRTASDANEDRAVLALVHHDDGTLASVAGVLDTARYCRRIVQLSDTPGAPAAPPPVGPLTDVRVDVTGPSDYVRPRAAELEALGCRVRTFRTDAVRVDVAESDGLPVAWRRFTDAHVPARGTPPVRVRALAAEHYGLTTGS